LVFFPFSVALFSLSLSSTFSLDLNSDRHVSFVFDQAQTFSQIVGSNGDDEGVINMENNDDQVIAAMGVITTMDTIAEAFDEEPEVMARIEPVLLGVAHHVLTNHIVGTFPPMLKRSDIPRRGFKPWTKMAHFSFLFLESAHFVTNLKSEPRFLSSNVQFTL
jgi:hypothetical protein